MQELDNIIYVLDELADDDTVPKNVKAKIADVKAILQSDEEVSSKKNKALDKLDQLNEDNNLKTYTRSQIWDLASMLERL